MRHHDDEPGADDGGDAAAGGRASSSSSRGDEATSETFKASLTAISELCEVPLLDVLAQAASDVLAAIPAERCVVYIYDKSANLLRPQVVVDCSHGDAVDKTNALIEDGSEGGGTAKSPLVSFPPVVGMVSSSFLQRRCLRMQEPNPHRTFHREYDAPKDLQVDSILCAPVILYRRATAVIQLLNRLDETEQGDRNPFAVLERVGTPQDATCEGTNDVKLRRLKSIKPSVKIGFSSKDEQKLLHFTTHIAQTIEMSLKHIANGRSQAKIREDKAKQAMDLLNSLNGKLGARVDKTEELVPTHQSDGVGRGFRVRRATLRRLPRSNLAPVNLLSSVVVVMQLQAMFRGRRERRAQKFAEALERYRGQRERVRSVMLMQRVTHRRETHDRLEAPPVLGRSGMFKSDHHRESVAVDQVKKTLPSPSKPQTRPLISEASPTRPAPFQRPSSVSEGEKLRKKKDTSVESIQHVAERQQKRQQPPIPVPVAPVHQLSDAFASIVKVQSFVRGSLARKWLRRARALHRGPPVVCLRVASPSRTVDSNQRSHESPRVTSLRSQTCIYPMPMRPGKNHTLMPRRRLEEEPSDDSRTVASHDSKRDTSSVQDNALLLWQADPDQPFDVQSRRLIASQVTEKPHRDSLRVPVPPSKARWHGSISAVWETARDPNRDLIPPGVELAKTYRDRQRNSSTTGTIGITSIGLPSLESQGASRLPAWRPGPATNKDALLCCLLPAQPRRLVGAAFTLPFPRPPAHTPKLQRMQARPKQGKRPTIKLENDGGRSNLG